MLLSRLHSFVSLRIFTLLKFVDFVACFVSLETGECWDCGREQDNNNVGTRECHWWGIVCSWEGPGFISTPGEEIFVG